MSLIAPLFMAIAEFFISRRPAKGIAEQNGVDLQSLNAALPKFVDHTWQGKLAAALANPTQRPDLIPLYVHLARLEQHHADLVAQLDRAQDLTNKIRSQEAINLENLVKAEAFTFKIHTAIGRLLKDIERAEIRLEKAQKPAPEQKPASGGRKSPEFSVAMTDPVSKITETPLQPPANPDPQATTVPPPDPFLNAILAQHRHRIKNTPANDRPALIARLLEQEHAKRKRQAA